jgi:hypothetical protein
MFFRTTLNIFKWIRIIQWFFITVFLLTALINPKVFIFNFSIRIYYSTAIFVATTFMFFTALFYHFVTFFNHFISFFNYLLGHSDFELYKVSQN